MAKRIVRMLKRYGSLNPGETGGFDLFEASALVLRGMAEWADPSQAEGAPIGHLPPLKTLKMGGLDVPVACNIAADAAALRAQHSKG